MNVAVEHRHRAKTPDRVEHLSSLLSSPVPLRIYSPQRNVPKNDEWRAGGPGLQIFCDPGELIIRQLAEPSLGADIDQPY